MEKKIYLLVVCLAIVVVDSAHAKVPAVFIFGDSTADVGTNNFLPASKDRADFPHYGIDFPHSRPTGRFSNGFNSADILAKLMGFNRSPPPYFALANNTGLIKSHSFKGANFASAGSGILNQTGQPKDGQRNVVPLGEQIDQFSSITGELIANKGQDDAAKFLCKSMFFISVGSNDIFAYYLSRSGVPKEEFLANLELAYENHLRNLYKLGARKFGIISVPPIGCCPAFTMQNTSGGCLENLNDLATGFYPIMGALLTNLSSEYRDMKYSHGNAYEMTMNVIENPSQFGYKDVGTACCGDLQTPCSPNATLCRNRNEFLFWDLFHPTQNASRLAALTLFTGEPPFVSPINFKQLAEA